MACCWGETRGQLRGIKSGHSGTPGVPYLIRWPHFLATVPLPTLCEQPRVAAQATLKMASCHNALSCMPWKRLSLLSVLWDKKLFLVFHF